jgi:predicted RNA-binding Zn-ribbon protein involved in translation (DUF1610 family)
MAGIISAAHVADGGCSRFSYPETLAGHPRGDVTAQYSIEEDIIMTTANDRMVEPQFACPDCGERDMDALAISDPDLETVDCNTCGAAYSLADAEPTGYTTDF